MAVAANHLSSAGRRGTKAEEEVVCDPAVGGGGEGDGGGGGSAD